MKEHHCCLLFCAFMHVLCSNIGKCSLDLIEDEVQRWVRKLEDVSSCQSIQPCPFMGKTFNFNNLKNYELF